MFFFFFFFFQAEDGIRDVAVTGVQTCALPISAHDSGRKLSPAGRPAGFRTGNTIRGERTTECGGVRLRLLTRPADGAGHHGASLVPGYSSRTTCACFLRQRLWWVPVDALSLERGCSPGPRRAPSTDRENRC